MGVEKFIPVVSAIFLHPVSALHGSRRVDSSAAEFRRRSQPAPYRAAAAGKNSARRHASRNLLKPPPPQFLWRAAAQVILTNCDTCRSSTTCHRCSRNCIGCECRSVSPSGWQFLLTAVSTTRRRVTSPPSSNRRATLVTGSVYARRRRPSSMFLAPNT